MATTAHVTVGSHGYWLQSDGTWTQDQAGQKPLSGSALTAAQQAYAQQGGTGTPAGQGSGGEATGAAGGQGAVPMPGPTPIMEQGLNESGRFGDYSSPQYNIGTSYAGPETSGMLGGVPGAPGGPSPAPAPTPTPTPTPAPTPSPAPPPSPSPVPSGGGLGGSGGWQGGYGRDGGGMLGGATTQGGMLSGGNGSGGTGPAGGTYAPGSSPPSPGDYIQPGWGVDLGLNVLSSLPGVYGLPATAALLGMHGLNTATSDSLDSGLGMGGLNFGQALGGVLGLNRYGSLTDPQIANKDAVSKATGGALNAGISPGGVYQPGLLARLFGDTTQTEYTPDEYARRQYAIAHPASLAGGNSSAGGMLGSGSGSQAAVKAGTQAPSSAAVSPKTADLGSPIYRSDGTIIGYSNNGVGSSAAAQNAIGIGGTANSPATTAAMGGGWNGGTSQGGGIGSGTGISGGGQGERAGFHRGGIVPGRPNGKVDDVRAMLDQGEAVIQQPAAKALGRGMLAALNNPRKARQLRGMLRNVA